MSIEAAALTITELEEEIRRENDRRYAFCRMLNATDRVLWRLEELNRDGVESIALGRWAHMRESLWELPAECLAVLPDTLRVQELLDGVFEVQDRLFRWRDPARCVDGEEGVPV